MIHFFTVNMENGMIWILELSDEKNIRINWKKIIDVKTTLNLLFKFSFAEPTNFHMPTTAINFLLSITQNCFKSMLLEKSSKISAAPQLLIGR